MQTKLLFIENLAKMQNKDGDFATHAHRTILRC